MAANKLLISIFETDENSQQTTWHSKSIQRQAIKEAPAL